MEDESPEERILLLTPAGRDASTLAEVLAKEGWRPVPCATLAELCEQLKRGAALLILTEEALDPDEIVCLDHALREQPPWSDLPLLILTSSRTSHPLRRTLAEQLAEETPVTLLERPLSIHSLVSATHAAWQARERQYELHARMQEQARLYAQLNFLADANAQLLSTSLDLATTLDSITTLLVPLLADVCAIYSREADGTARLLSVAGAGPAFAHVVRALREAPLLPRPERSPASNEGQRVLAGEEAEALLRAWTTNEKQARQVGEWGVTSALVVPLRANHDRLGVLLLLTLDPRSPIGQQEVALIERLAPKAATAVYNATAHRTVRRQLSESRERERQRLAHDLHDVIIQQVLGLRFQLSHFGSGLEHVQSLSEERRTLIATLDEKLLHITQATRRLISDLRPQGLDQFGLNAALEGFISEMARAHGPEMPRIMLDLDPAAATLPHPLASDLFRIAQEALRNTLKHAAATEAAIRITVTDDEVTLTVTDNGQGFTLPERLSDLAEEQHFGLLGLRERAELRGGQVEIRSAPGAGTTIRARIPRGGTSLQGLYL